MQQEDSTNKDDAKERNAILSKQKISDAFPIYTSAQDFFDAAFIPKTVVNINYFKDTPILYENIKMQMEKILTMSNQNRAKFLDELLNEVTITEKDCNKYKLPHVMISQKGIIAKKDIKKNTVLGFYSGIYARDLSDIIHLKSFFTNDQLSLYTYSLGSIGSYPRIIGYKYGNKLSLINASISYDKSAHELAKEYNLRNNLIVIRAKSGENSYQDDPNFFDLVTFITLKDIKKGEQLFYDYGIGYWQDKRKIDFEKLDNEMQEELAKIQKNKKPIKKFF